jgi:hypothetical protein
VHVSLINIICLVCNFFHVVFNFNFDFDFVFLLIWVFV